MGFSQQKQRQDLDLLASWQIELDNNAKELIRYEMTSSVAPTEVVQQLNIIDEQLMAMPIDILDMVSQYKKDARGYLNDGGFLDGTTTQKFKFDWSYNPYSLRLSGVVHNASKNIATLMFTGTKFGSVNSLQTKVEHRYVQQDSKFYIESVKLYRTVKSPKTGSLLVNEFFLDYVNNKSSLRSDSDKRFDEKNLGMYRTAMNQIIGLINTNPSAIGHVVANVTDIGSKTDIIKPPAPKKQKKLVLDIIFHGENFRSISDILKDTEEYEI